MTLQKIKAFLLKSENNHILLAISSALFVLRSNIPYAIYIFALIQTVAFINTFKTDRFKYITNILKSSLNSFYAYYLIIFFFIVGFLIAPRITEAYKDLMNLFILSSFILLFIVEINTLNSFKKFKEAFLISFIILFSGYLLLSFFISAATNNLGNFFFAIKNFESFDRNIYSLNLWISIIALFTLVKNFEKKWIIPANIYLFILILLVLFSSSRRGIIILAIFSIIFIFFYIYFYIKKKNNFKNFRTLFILYSLMLFLFLTSILMPGSIRNEIFKTTINNQKIKKEISQTTHRYFRLIKPQSSLEEYQFLLWGQELNHNSDQNLNQNSAEGSEMGYRQLLNTAKIKYENKDYTESINLIRTAVDKTDSLGQFYNLLPQQYIEKLTGKDKSVVTYLPELAKLPYSYSNFFSCINIENLFLENYIAANDFPYTFSFKKNQAKINLTLPALSNSEYELNFMIKATKNPLEEIITTKSTNTSIQIKKNNYQNHHTFFYNNKISILNNNKVSLGLSILFKNNVNRFAISDIKWKLINTHNAEKPEIIYKKAKGELKKFKFEQNRSKWLWRSYLNAERLINADGRKKYSKEEITALLNKSAANIRPLQYVSTKIEKEEDQYKIIFQNAHAFPRARFNLPIIQHATYKLEFDCIKESEKLDLISYFKRKPEMYNVYLKYEILSDSTHRYSNYHYKKVIKFKVDSINSATSIFAFGYKNLKQNDTLIVKNAKFELLEIEGDSVLLSDAQYNYLKNWADRGKRNEKVVALEKETAQLENESYWQIDSSVYQSAAADRLELWLFGWQYFKSLPILNKIFGDGFKYYQVYKLRFGEKYGYRGNYFPHNPIISALLYSGIIGVLAYIFFLVQLFYYYIKNRKDLGIFLILFALIFTYSFVSGKTHFTITYYVLFSIFPFLINFIKNKEKQNIKSNA